MKKSTRNGMIIWGAVTLLLLFLSVWYAVQWNDSRLVAPMDLTTYTFRAKDLPMIIAGLLTAIYVVSLFGVLFRTLWRNNRLAQERKVTRQLNPKLGCLGFLGLLGFAGIWTYQIDGSVFPFAFFLFFGFFGFYYEGKMSGTFMDERFRENAVRAQLGAIKVSGILVFFVLLILCQGELLGHMQYTVIAATVLLAIALALYIFLSEYLLYRYDYDEQLEEE